MVFVKAAYRQVSSAVGQLAKEGGAGVILSHNHSDRDHVFAQE